MIAALKKPLRFEATLEGGDNNAILFYKPATVTERDMFEADVDAMNAGEVYPWHLQEVFFEGLKALAPDNTEEVDRIADLYNRMLSGEDGLPDNEKLTVPEKSEVTEIVNIMIEKYPPFQTLFKRQKRREHLLPTLAVRRFMCGFEDVLDHEGNPAVFRVSPDGMVPDDILQMLTPLTIRAFGLEIYRNMYGLDARKNSAPPSKSGGTQKTSKGLGRGKSVKKSGAKTRS